MTLEVCSSTIIHEDKVNTVNEILLEKDLSNILLLSKCIKEPSRIKILYALMTYNELCVCDLAAVLEASIASTSHHMRYLKQNGLLESKRNGRVVYYSLIKENAALIFHSLTEFTQTIPVPS
ncbi:ArsR/SmtB family transcription factor [Alkalibacterium pelagium]|uniref:DNA-binding transcriptional regulator, ArsR family n=1 Tax=Alkalibacterium pelagium TaxID=426702 RepID=A0A1H7P6D3_9LACT|nr:metalloregulator ArsR/SmtB family transcription factor [Alkalibacterium pelagium]SEL31323.1 DNA-binding transcriptional regulator, ArsR family [Alkalibacterium pelagium]